MAGQLQEPLCLSAPSPTRTESGSRGASCAASQVGTVDGHVDRGGGSGTKIAAAPFSLLPFGPRSRNSLRQIRTLRQVSVVVCLRTCARPSERDADALPAASRPDHSSLAARVCKPRVALRKSRLRESRTLGSVRAKANALATRPYTFPARREGPWRPLGGCPSCGTSYFAERAFVGHGCGEPTVTAVRHERLSLR